LGVNVAGIQDVMWMRWVATYFNVHAMGGASWMARGSCPPVPYALTPTAPNRSEKKLYVPYRPFPSIIAS